MSTKYVYNPFNKAFWTKENMINTEKVNKAKEEFAKAKEELSNSKVDGNSTSKKISKIGWKLTLGITIPLILSAIFGVLGMVIGGIIFLFTVVSLFK